MPLHHAIDEATTTSDSLSGMMERERTVYACHDYLSNDQCDFVSSLLGRQHGNRLTPEDRMKVVDWSYDVVDRCQFDRDTVAMATNLFDRFMSFSSRSSCPQVQAVLYDIVQCQLVAMTALYISIKTNERVLFSSKDFADMSRGIYTAEDIESMELQILQGLKWRTCPPTSLQVSHQMCSLMLPQITNTIDQGTWDFVREEVAFMSENAVRDFYFATRRPSTIAAAAILNAIEQVNERSFQPLMEALLQVLTQFDFESPMALLEARGRLKSLMNENDANGSAKVVETAMATEVVPQKIHMVSPTPEKKGSYYSTAATTLCTMSDDNSIATRY